MSESIKKMTAKQSIQLANLRNLITNLRNSNPVPPIKLKSKYDYATGYNDALDDLGSWAENMILKPDALGSLWSRVHPKK